MRRTICTSGAAPPGLPGWSQRSAAISRSRIFPCRPWQVGARRRFGPSRTGRGTWRSPGWLSSPRAGGISLMPSRALSLPKQRDAPGVPPQGTPHNVGLIRCYAPTSAFSVSIIESTIGGASALKTVRDGNWSIHDTGPSPPLAGHARPRLTHRPVIAGNPANTPMDDR